MNRWVSGGLIMDQLSKPGISYISSKQFFEQQSISQYSGNFFSVFLENV